MYRRLAPITSKPSTHLEGLNRCYPEQRPSNRAQVQGVKFLYIPIFSYIFGHFLFSPIFQRNSYFFLYFRGFIVVRAITFHEIMHILPVLVETFFDLQCYLYLYEYNLHVLD